ncbi:MAG: hypothetical protein K9G30_06260 [Parvibaculum sp.]|nr:hypothetical protein [Parvibaculum sp.]
MIGVGTMATGFARLFAGHSAERRANRMNRMERIYASANAGLWGDAGLMIAAAEAMEWDRHLQKKEKG